MDGTDGTWSKAEKNAERKTSLEQASFDSSYIGSRMFAKAPLLPTGLLSLAQLPSQIPPALIILGAQLLHRKDLLLAGHRSHHPHRATNHHARNGPSSARRAPLMDACDSETVLQVIVRAGQSCDVITAKQPCGEVVGGVAKMLKRLHKRPQSSKVIPHPCQMSQIPFANPLPQVLLGIGQDAFGPI